MSPQFDQDMQMRARVERMTRGKGGRQQTVLALAGQIKLTRASRGRGEHQCDPPDDGGNPPLQALDENVSQRRRKKKGEPRQLDLTGGCARGVRKARRGRGRGRRGQTKTIVTRGVTVGGAFATSSSSSEAEVSDGEERREGEEGVERDGNENDFLNVSEHLEAMTLADHQQPDIDPAAVSGASRRDTRDITFHPSAVATTPSRPCPQSRDHSTPHSLQHEHDSSLNLHRESSDQRLSSSRCAVNVYDTSMNNSSILVEGTPAEQFNCGVFCTLRGMCNH